MCPGGEGKAGMKSRVSTGLLVTSDLPALQWLRGEWL